jgi:hypothetical protein
MWVGFLTAISIITMFAQAPSRQLAHGERGAHKTGGGRLWISQNVPAVR